MSFIEADFTVNNQLTQRQRWSFYGSLLLIFISLYIGYTFRESALTQTVEYSNIEAGISSAYPSRWLVDEDGDYVFRIRDMSNRGFKTSIQVQTLPVSPDIVERNLLDRLTLSRSQFLIDYNVLGYSEFELRNEISAVAMNYTYVSRDASPFLEGISTVVIGLDILTIQRGQALVITFRADSSIYERELTTFNQFLENLSF